MDPETTRIAFAIGASALAFGAGSFGATMANMVVSSAAERQKAALRAEKERLEAEIERMRRELQAFAGSTATPSGKNEPARPAPAMPVMKAATVTAAAPAPQEGAKEIAAAKPASSLYPEPEIVIPPDAALAKIPSAKELRPVSGTDIPWAWADAGFRRNRTVVVPSDKAGTGGGAPVFVVGDLHGDAESFRKILAHVYAASENAMVVFLGDLVDRGGGPATLECARLLVWAALAHPGRVLWIRGNHDFLSWNEEKGKFASKTAPHEFVDFLNDNPDLRQEGLALAAIMETLPVAAAVGNVFLSHGGVLQDDDAGVRSFAGLAAPTDAQASDFTWSRMRDVRSKIASRVSKGAEVGFRQAEKFVEKLRETDGIEIAHLVCGHQHEAKDGFGYLPFEKNFAPSLTCQCVTSFFNRDAFDGPARPAILRLDGGDTPVPVFFPMPE